MTTRRVVGLAWVGLLLGLSAGTVVNADVVEGDGMGIVTAFYPERGTVKLGDSDIVPLSGEAARQLGDYVKQMGWPIGTKLLAKFDVSGGIIQSILIEGRLEP